MIDEPAPSHDQASGGASYRPGDPVRATRVVLRPMANPLSLGFLGLAFATTLFSGLELGWVPASEGKILALAVLVFTVPVQFIACVFGFLTRDLVASSGMGVLAGTWASTALTTLVSPPGSTSPALGLVLVVSAAAVLMPATGAARSKLLAASVNIATALRWLVTAGFEFSDVTAWEVAAGWMGIALGVLALYASLAFEIEDQVRKTVLPTFRRKAGTTAMKGDLAAQVAAVANEAGVRKQL
ncbi:MAG: GPR1/FUN34/YaaH family transporter [Acidimicrobiales bacterium]